MSEMIREFHRADREQLTELVNLHVASVLPGVALSTNVVLGQLEREPGERIVDPWVDDRVCLVATQDDALVAAALLHRFSGDPQVRVGYRGAADIRWLLCHPDAMDLGRKLLDAVIELVRSWNPAHVYADGTLPAPGCYGVPDSWPHIRLLLTEAGFAGPTRTELVLAIPCSALTGHRIDGVTVRRSVGTLGTRLDLVDDGRPLGYIEVGELPLTRSTTGSVWSDVGNLFVTKGETPSVVMPALLAAAAEWLTLGGVERLIDYYADDVHEPEYLAVLQRLGFVLLSTNERGWELPS